MTAPIRAGMINIIAGIYLKQLVPLTGETTLTRRKSLRYISYPAKQKGMQICFVIPLYGSTLLGRCIPFYFFLLFV